MKSKFYMLPLLMVVALVLCTGPDLAAQCNTGWLWVQDVTLGNGGGTATNYFALLTVNTATPITDGKMRSDGGDIRITDASCNPLDFWVESGLNTSATKIWVEIPSLPNGSTTISMYYGNPTATRTNQASDIFGSGIAALYTFTEGSGGTLHDWVGGYDLTISNLAWGSGFRSDVGSLTGFSTGRAYRGDNGPSLGSGDFSAVVFGNAGNPDGSTEGLVGNYNGDGTSGWTLKMQGSPGRFMLLTNQSGGWCQGSGGTVSANTWTMISGVRNTGSDPNKLYVNGSLANSICSGDTRNVNNSGPFEIGRSYNGRYPFDGKISLVAVYDQALSDNGVSDLHGSLYPATQPTVTNGTEESNVQLTAPADVTIECDESTLPANTGTATVVPAGYTITYSDVVNAGACDNSYSITRTWSVSPVTGVTITADQTITVEDSEDPTINLAATVIELSPPNHSYHTVNVSDFVASVGDNCATLDVDDVVITRVTSDEAENGDDDGNTTDDMVISSDCRSVDLRAERSGDEDGRVYRIYVLLSDGCGNTATASFPVSVRRGRAAATEGSAVYTETSSCAPVLTKQGTGSSGTGHRFFLSDNYPNPTGGVTTIEYGLGVTGHVTLQVIDGSGRLQAELVNGMQEAGDYTLQLNVGDLPAGAYFYVLEADGKRLVRSMTVSR